MARFRQKPIVIEAVQWNGEPVVLRELGVEYNPTDPERPFWVLPDGALVIDNKEGDMVAEKGSWIIKGIEGEFYSCKDSVFRATYDRVPAADWVGTGPLGAT